MQSLMKFHSARPIEAKGQVKMGRAGPARPIAEERTQNASLLINKQNTENPISNNNNV